MKITKLTFSYYPDFDSDACSSAQDNLVVKIHTDSGLWLRNRYQSMGC